MKNFKTILLVLLSVVFLSLHNNIFSQKITDRYVEIKDPDSFLIYDEQTNTYYTNAFELINIMENESSKPVQVSVDEIPNVVNFSIKSKSFEKENQRTCYLRIKSENYKYTLYQVLNKMGVKYIFDGTNFINIKDYFKEKYQL